jgi:hypothetical protein
MIILEGKTFQYCAWFHLEQSIGKRAFSFYLLVQILIIFITNIMEGRTVTQLFFFFSFSIIGQKSFINSSLYLDSSFNLISDCVGYGMSEVAKLFKLLKQSHL